MTESAPATSTHITATTVMKDRLKRVSFVLGLMTGIGCNLSSFGLCFLINAILEKCGVDQSFGIEMVCMLSVGAVICSMAVGTLILADSLLATTYTLALLSNNAVDDDVDNVPIGEADEHLQDIKNRFECRFLMGTISSGALSIALVLLAHVTGWIPITGDYHNMPWLLYSTQILLIVCLWSVWNCERSYLEARKKYDDECAAADDDNERQQMLYQHLHDHHQHHSLQKPLLMASVV